MERSLSWKANSRSAS